MSKALAKRVLLIGWDAADWKMIQPLLEQGHMPALQRTINEGTWGNLATLRPVFSPMLWTSIATGKRPHKHGIHGFIEPAPDGQGVRPSSSTTRSTKAIWNILTQKGFRSHAVGWFCSHPAEPINGVCVTELFDRVTAAKPEEWKLPDDCVHPLELAETLAELRLHPTELLPEHILPFIPQAAKIDQKKDRRIAAFAKLLCEMINIHSAATWIMEHRDWDFMAVFNPAIDHFCHAFMKYHPPRMPAVPEEAFEIYKDVVVGCYRFHDIMLARMLQLAGEDATVVICSDHGFHCDHLRPRAVPRVPAGPAVWHRDYGILCMKGPGIRKGERVYGASLLDVTPTILSLFDLPIGADMDGKPLVAALSGDRHGGKDGTLGPPRIDSWDKLGGNAGMHSPEKREDPYGAREAVRQLVALGYVEKPDENAERAAMQADREARYNLARSLLDAGLVKPATELLEVLWHEQNRQSRHGFTLAQAYLAGRRRSAARKLVEQVLDLVDEEASRAADGLERRRQLLHQFAARRTESDVSGSETNSQNEPALNADVLERIDERITSAQQRLREQDARVMPRARLLLGVLELGDRKLDTAVEHLKAAEKVEPRLPGLHLHIGRAYLRMKRWRDSLRAFEKALDIDGDSARAHHGKAAALLRLGQPDKAADHALIAVELLHHYPQAHYCLGVALHRLGLVERAVEAFNACIKIAPTAITPHRRLEQIYRKRLNRPDLAAHYQNKIDFIRRARRPGRRAASKRT